MIRESPKDAVRTVRVVDVVGRPGAQVLVCHEPETGEWPVLVLPLSSPRVEPGDAGIIRWIEDGARSGWDFAKGVAS